MSNLNDAFLKAYAKRPADKPPLNSGTAQNSQRGAVAKNPQRFDSKLDPLKDVDNEQLNHFLSAAGESLHPATSRVPAAQVQNAAEPTATAVVSSMRSSSKSATVRKVIPPHSAAAKFDGPDDRHFRVDEVPQSKVDPSVLAPAQQPTQKQVKRQPLSEYLAEMRQQVSEVEQRTGSQNHDRVARRAEQIPVQELPQRRPSAAQPVAQPAVYTYPEKQAMRVDAGKASPAFIDKRTLRQLASSNGPVTTARSEEPEVRSGQISHEDAETRHQNAPSANRNAATSKSHPAPQPTMEPLNVRDTWREAERIHRVSNSGHSVNPPHVDNSRKSIQTPPETTVKDVQAKKVERRIDEPAARSREVSAAPHWKDEARGASEAMVESLAGYNPNSESSVLYRQTKISGVTNKSKIEQKLARSNESIVAPLNPEWEVDVFQWPFTVLDLLESQETAFEEIANHLIAANRKGLKTVAITSAERGVGKSTTCMCLAALMAHKELRIAIVDGDIEYPSLFNQLNLEFPHGWQDCIRSNIPLESVAVKSIGESITLFPLTDSMSTEEIGVNRIKVNHLLRRIAKSYDMVFIDTHRINYRSNQLIGTGDDAALDAALVIVDSELSVKERIDTTLQMLHDQKINSIGVVENFSGLDLSTDQDS